MSGVYEYLLAGYKGAEPIFLSDLQVPNVSSVGLRQELKKLVDTGKLKRFDTGIYYIPGKSRFESGGALPVEKVILSKYVEQDDMRFGYLSGMLFFNQLGLTTQVPAVYEVCSNKATAQYRELDMQGMRVIVRKPKAPITKENYLTLQFLDMITDVDVYAELEGTELRDRMFAYMQASGITVEKLKPYFRLYPDRMYRNLVETEVIYFGVSA